MGLTQLSPAERAVFDVVLEGLSNRAVAERLGLVEGTVRTHVTHVFKKLRVDSRSAMIAAYGSRTEVDKVTLGRLTRGQQRSPVSSYAGCPTKQSPM